MIVTPQQVLGLPFELNNNDIVGATATQVGSTPLVTGKIGKAVSFPGTSGNYFHFPNSTFGSRLNGAIAVTCSAWISPANISGNKTIVLSWMGSVSGVFFRLIDGNVQMGGRSQTSDSFQTATTTTSPISASTWTHVVGVLNYTAKTAKVYVNGVLLVTATSLAFGQNTYTHTAGAAGRVDPFGYWIPNADPQPFNGLIDDFRMYRGELSLPDIKRLYLAMHPLNA